MHGGLVKINCRDMGMPACAFVAVGKTAEETKRKLTEHGMKSHADKLKGMSEAEKQAMARRMDELLAGQK